MSNMKKRLNATGKNSDDPLYSLDRQNAAAAPGGGIYPTVSDPRPTPRQQDYSSLQARNVRVLTLYMLQCTFLMFC